ncbi:MAG: caspase family protein [Acidimicrobiales bacterium]
MRAGRWIGAAVAALAIAILPGALRLVPAGSGADRAHPFASGSIDAREPGAVAPAALAPTPPTTPPPPAGVAPDEVAITPPAQLTGALAPAVPVPAPFEQARGSGQQGSVFALIVGINDYPGSQYDLGAAVADANTVNDALAKFGVPAGNRVVLRDGQARRDQVVSAVKALVQRAGPGSTVVFAYSGHVRKLDGDTEAIIAADGRALTDQQLASLLAPSRATNMWLLLATCYAGGFTELLGPGRVLTAAADANSLAYESPSLKGSYLVHHMVREGWLQGNAGPSVQEAFAYADARIKERYPSRRPLQFDRTSGRLQFGSSAQTTAASTSQPRPASPPPTTTTTQPDSNSCFLVFCRDS